MWRGHQLAAVWYEKASWEACTALQRMLSSLQGRGMETQANNLRYTRRQ